MESLLMYENVCGHKGEVGQSKILRVSDVLYSSSERRSQGLLSGGHHVKRSFRHEHSCSAMISVVRSVRMEHVDAFVRWCEVQLTVACPHLR